MTDFDTTVEMAELNHDLAELWLEELDLYQVHFSASSEVAR